MIKTRCPGLSMIAWNWAEGGEDKPEVRKGLGGWIRQPAYWWRRLHFRCLGRGCYQSPIEMADTTDPVATARAALLREGGDILSPGRKFPTLLNQRVLISFEADYFKDICRDEWTLIYDPGI